MWIRSLGQEEPLEEDMETIQYSCLENPHGQRHLEGEQSVGLHRVSHN